MMFDSNPLRVVRSRPGPGTAETILIDNRGGEWNLVSHFSRDNSTTGQRRAYLQLDGTLSPTSGEGDGNG